MKNCQFIIAFLVSFLLALSAWADSYDYDNSKEGSFETWKNWIPLGSLPEYNGQTTVPIRVGFNEGGALWTPTITLDNSSAEYTCGGIVISYHKLTGATLVIQNGKLTSSGIIQVGLGNSVARGTSTNTITHGTLTVNAGGTLAISNNRAVFLAQPSTGDLDPKCSTEGTINVNGGTITTGSGAWNLGCAPASGYTTKGTLNITNGGTVTATGATFTLGQGGKDASGFITVDGAESKLTLGTLNVGTVAGGTGKVTVSNGGTISYTTLNLGTANGASGTLEIDNSSLSINTQNFATAENSTGNITVSNGGTLNLLNANSSGTPSFSCFSTKGNFTLKITGGTVNNYGQIYTGENAKNANLTVNYDFSGGVFNHVGNTFDYSGGKTPTAEELKTIGGGRFCMASHANGLMKISGTAEVNINAEYILTWQDYSGTVEQSGGTANIWGGRRANVQNGGNGGLDQWGIIFSNNGSTSGKGTYKLSGGTLNTYRLASRNNKTDTNFVVSGGEANIQYKVGIGSSGQIEVATQQSGGTVTANILTYTNGGNWATSDSVYGYSLSQAKTDVPSVLNAERLYLNNNSKTDKTVTFKQTGGTSTFQKFTTGSAGDPAGVAPIQLEKGAKFDLSGGTSNWKSTSRIFTGSNVTVSGGALNVSAAQTITGANTAMNLSGGKTTYTNFLYVGNGAAVNLSGDAVLVSAWGTGRGEHNTTQLGNSGTGSLSITGNAKAYISGLSIGTVVGTTGNVTVDGENAALNLVNSATKTGEPATQTFFGDSGICNITLKNGGTLNNYGEIFSSEYSNQSKVTINIEGGTFHHYGWDSTRTSGVEGLLDTALNGGGRFCLSSRGQNSINLSSGEFISEGEFILVWSHDNSASGTINQTGGNATFRYNGSTIGVRHNIGNTKNSDFGAAINFSGDGTANGVATYNLSGGTMTADSMASRKSTVKAQFNVSGTGVADVGTLKVNTLMTGGTLSATTVNIPTSTNSDWTYATTFYQTGGALSPALDEIGTMTFKTPYTATGNVTYEIDYDPTATGQKNDQIAFSSTADLTGTNLFFEINMNGAELSENESFDLAIFSGTKPTGMNSISGVLTNYITSNPEVVYALDFSKLVSDGKLSIQTGLPEPATWILLVSGLVLLAGRKKFGVRS